MIGKTEEVSFPRGATTAVVENANITIKHGKSTKKKPEKDLFSNKGTATFKKDKKAKKKKAIVNKSSLDINNVTNLSYSLLNEGQVLLGFVTQVLEFEVKMSLP